MKMGNLFQQDFGQSDKAYDQYLKCHAIIKSMAEKTANVTKSLATTWRRLTLCSE